MKTGQKTGFILLCITTFIIGFMIGCIFDAFLVSNSGIPGTSYCKEVQVDTLLYNYPLDMYKYKVKLIK